MNKSLPFVCLVLGVAVGWFLNKKPGTPLEASPSTAAAEVYPQNAKRALASTQGGALVVNESLVKDVSTATSFEDKDAKIDVLENSRSLTNTIEILKIVSQMSESELRASLSSAGERGMGSIDDFIMPYFKFLAWVEINPGGAYDFYQNEANAMQKQMYARSLFSAWATKDPKAAMAAVDAIENEHERAMALSSVGMSMAGTDPEGAYELLSTRTESNPWHMQSLFVMWGAKDPDAAMAKINTMEPGNIRTQSLAGLISGIAQTDIQRAAGVAMGLEREQERNQSLQSIMYMWVNQDADGAIEFLEGLDNGKLKNDLVRSASWMMAEHDPERTLEFVDANMAGRDRDDAVLNVVRNLSSKNPQDAAALLDSMPYGRVYTQSVQSIASNWGSKEPIAALEWARALEAGEEKDRAIDSVLSNFAMNKTDEAKVYLQSMSDGEEKNKLVHNIGKGIAQKDPMEAIVWSQSLSDELSKIAFDGVIGHWAYQYPAKAVEYLERTNDAESMNKHVYSIANSWVRTDIKGAAAWSLTLEDEAAQKNAIRRVAEEWLDHNTEEASIWISELERGAPRDSAVDQLVNKVRRSDPEVAFAWAATVGDVDQRQRLTRYALRDFAKEEPEQVKELIRTSDLSEEEKEKLNKLVKD